MNNIKYKVIGGYVDVFEDSYTDGDGDCVNYFTLSDISRDLFLKDFESKEEALKAACAALYWTYSEFEEGDEGVFYNSWLVDNENNEVEASERAYTDWKSGKKTLYAANLITTLQRVQILDFK